MQMVFLIDCFCNNDRLDFLFYPWYFRRIIDDSSGTSLLWLVFFMILYCSQNYWLFKRRSIDDNIFRKIGWSEQESSKFLVYLALIIIYLIVLVLFRTTHLWLHGSYFLFARLILNYHYRLQCFCYIFCFVSSCARVCELFVCSWIL